MLAVVVFVGLWAVATGKGHWTWSPLYRPDTFSWQSCSPAPACSVVSFFGFDGISLLAEEAQRRPARRSVAMLVALPRAGVLFIAQTWVAAMLTPDPKP